jgi:nucleotide-binding universal stress UspA family protein
VVGRTGSFVSRRLVAAEVPQAVTIEAGRDYDLVMIGAAPDSPLHDALLQRVLRHAPTHVVLVRSADRALPQSGARLLVPVDGSLFSRYAAEFAFAFAGAAGGSVTLLHVISESRLASGSFPLPERRSARTPSEPLAQEVGRQLEQQFGALADRYGVALATRVLAGGAASEIIVAESSTGYHDLLVIGAENKLLGASLFYGQGTAAILERAGCTTAVVVPRVD